MFDASLFRNDVQARVNAFVADSNVPVTNTRKAEYFGTSFPQKEHDPDIAKHLGWQAHQGVSANQIPAIPPPQNARKRLRLTPSFFMINRENRGTNF
jgi:hypothetical protein